MLGKDSSTKGGSTHEFELVKTLTGHKDAVCAIDSASDGALVASSDDSGTILVRNVTNDFDIVHRLTGDGYPATSLRFCHNDWLVTAYLTGKIRIFRRNSFTIHAEIAAHSRAITALDAFDSCFASVGEDTFLNVWEISKTGGRVKLVSSQRIANDLLSGVAFAGAKHLVTAAYDTSNLKLWVPE